MLQEILDEVIDGTPHYNVEDNPDGTKTIELANIILEAGTPINKALFNNLQGDLYTQDRYNVPTAVRLSNSEVPLTRFDLNLPLTSYEKNKIVNVEIPTLNATINSATPIPLESMDLEEISASSNYALVNNVFDREASTHWYSKPGDENTTPFVRIKFKTPVKLKTIVTRVTASSSSYVSNIRLQGSNNGTSWTTLYNYNGVQNNLTEINLSGETGYIYYQIAANLVDGAAAQLYIYEWQILEYEGVKKIFYDGEAKININNLGAKDIVGKLISGRKQSLMYNGTSWEVVSPYYVEGTYVGDDTIDNSKKIYIPPNPNMVILWAGSEGDYGGYNDIFMGVLTSTDFYGWSQVVSSGINLSGSYGIPKLFGDYFIPNYGATSDTTGWNNRYKEYKYIAIY